MTAINKSKSEVIQNIKWLIFVCKVSAYITSIECDHLQFLFEIPVNWELEPLQSADLIPGSYQDRFNLQI